MPFARDVIMPEPFSMNAGSVSLTAFLIGDTEDLNGLAHFSITHTARPQSRDKRSSMFTVSHTCRPAATLSPKKPASGLRICALLYEAFCLKIRTASGKMSLRSLPAQMLFNSLPSKLVT